MQRKFFIVLFSVCLAPSVSGQQPQYDTIPYYPGILKSTGKFIIETTADTVLTVVINELLASNSDLVYDNAGDDDDWFEIYNYGEIPIQLNDLYFSDNPSIPHKWKIDTAENIFLEPGGFMFFWADDEPEQGYNHTNFKLSAEGEFLGIFDKNGTLIDYIVTVPQTTNISYGRTPNAGLDWLYFIEPTPGTPNSTEGAQGVLPSPQCNMKGGFYSSEFQVLLTSPFKDAEIRYTLNCNDPDMDSPACDGTFTIDTTTILKARLFKDGYIAGPVLTQSFFFENNPYDNPILSIVSNHDHLYGIRGLITTRSKTMEIPAHLEYITDNDLAFSSGAGLQLHAVKAADPISLRLYARSRYGNQWFENPFFKESAPDVFKRLILRNAANDNLNRNGLTSHMRDPLIQEIARQSNRNARVSASQPVNVYLNGSYYGLLNMRERIDEAYIETHTGIAENFDLLERAFGYDNNDYAIYGTFDNWNALLTFVDTTGDLSNESDFREIEEQVDLDNFTDYWITEVFAGNFDWLSNNIKFWKPHNHGKWQWVYWDTDHGLGLEYSDYGEVEWNTLEWSLGFRDRAWNNGYNNILLRNLLKNEGYRDHFIKRFTLMINTSLSFKETGPILEEMKSLYKNDLVHHAQRWKNNYSTWEPACETIKNYLQNRPAIVLEHIEGYFELNEPVQVSFEVVPEGGGTIFFEKETITNDSFTGRFFPDLDYEIAVTPMPGFTLSELLINGETATSDRLHLTDTTAVFARFSPVKEVIPLQITEVYFNNRNSFDSGDWIEFYYYGSEPLDLSGAIIQGKNEEILFTFEEGTVIPADQYFLVTENKNDFLKIFPDSLLLFEGLNQKISLHRQIKLISGTGVLYKYISIEAGDGWPVLTEEGHSIELKNITDNLLFGSSWQISKNIFGSPGLSNQSMYDFNPPRGIDTLLNNRENTILDFTIPNELYSDPDGHELAAVQIIAINGPGEFYTNNIKLSENSFYEPIAISFIPNEPYSNNTQLVYRLIDCSGQSSSIHIVRFSDLTKLEENKALHLKQYPNPVASICHFEINESFSGPFEFTLTDITGKTLLKRIIYSEGGRYTTHLSEIPAGLYIYILKSDEMILQGKIQLVK
jgi:hypothetical protein